MGAITHTGYNVPFDKRLWGHDPNFIKMWLYPHHILTIKWDYKFARVIIFVA